MSDFSILRPVETNFAMTEATRIAYLQAMGIDCWIPKSEQGLAGEITDRQNVQNQEERGREASQINQSLIDESTDKNGLGDETKNLPTLEKDTADEPEQPVNEVILSPPKSQTEVNEIAAESTLKSNKHLKSNKYLKLVNWTNQNIREESSKKLLIICRHQIDQPANSFARQNSPSQFMLDYINALIGLVAEPSFELKVQLAHLSEAGLSNESIPMDEVLCDSKPDLVLVLGDETAAHLIDPKADVASLRGRLVSLGQNQKALVSYHPYSLIENSSLKSLALNDLIGLANYLSQNSRA